jgi:cell wall-associated NlpC family hydrolase
MPQHSSILHPRRGAVILTLVLGLIVTAPLAALAEPVAPDTPTNSADAQQRWLNAGREAAALNDQVLQAGEALTAATATATAAAEAVTEAKIEVDAATAAAAVADADLAAQRQRIDRFVNASFRGARLNSLAPLLTAQSPDDYLDQVTALDRVAADAGNTLDQAAQARQAATAAAEHRAHAVDEAAQWQIAADAARTAAEQAATDLDTRKADLDRQAGVYQALYDQLSEQERQQAIADQEERDAAAARAATQTEPPAQAGSADDPPAALLAAADGAPQPVQVEAADRGRTDPAPAAGGSQAGQAAVAAALSKVGSAYVWGAAGPDAFDCSGLTSWAWKQAGVTIPRTSREQQGLTSVPMDQLQPGDLVTYYSPVSHVAMYIGNGQVVQASTPSKPVYVTDVYRGGPNPSGHRPQA